MKMATLHPIHKSIKATKHFRSPNRMTRISIDPELAENLTNIALDIFADCVNSNLSLQESLLSIYLSGLENGKEASTEQINAKQRAAKKNPDQTCV